MCVCVVWSFLVSERFFLGRNKELVESNRGNMTFLWEIFFLRRKFAQRFPAKKSLVTSKRLRQSDAKQ